MNKFIIVLLFFVFIPFSLVSAYYPNRYSVGYDDGYYDGYDDGYYDSLYKKLYEEEEKQIIGKETTESKPSSSPKKENITVVSLILRGGLQVMFIPEVVDSDTSYIVNRNTQIGGFGEVALGLDIYYFYMQMGLGFSSGWARNWQPDTIDDEENIVAPESQNGTYVLFSTGLVLPQIGLRIGAGIQFYAGYFLNSTVAEEVVDEGIDIGALFSPYIDIIYEYRLADAVTLSLGARVAFPQFFKQAMEDDGTGLAEIQNSIYNTSLDVMLGLNIYF